MALTKEETKAYNKKYYLENKEKLDATNKAWVKANPEKSAALKRTWEKANAEKYAAQKRTWNKANPEKCAAQKRTWAKANREKRNACNKTYYLKLNLANKNISQRTLHAWSAQVRERDTACLYCGSTDKLHAHHILSKSKHPEHALFLNNGITLCEPCHIQEHSLNGDL